MMCNMNVHCMHQMYRTNSLNIVFNVTHEIRMFYKSIYNHSCQILHSMETNKLRLNGNQTVFISEI